MILKASAFISFIRSVSVRLIILDSRSERCRQEIYCITTSMLYKYFRKQTISSLLSIKPLLLQETISCVIVLQ